MTDDDLTIRGGAGGIIAHAEEILALAGRVDAISNHVYDARRTIGTVRADLDARGSGSAGGGLGVLDARLAKDAVVASSLADGLRATARAYVDAEDRARAAIGSADGRLAGVRLGRLLGEGGPLLGPLAALFPLLGILPAVLRGEVELGADEARFLANLGASFLLAVPPGLSSDDDPLPDAAALLLALGAVGVGVANTATRGPQLSTLQVTPVAATTSTENPSSQKPSNETDLLRLVAEQYAGEPGQVAVQRLEHADGSVGWVVAVPGTQSLGLGGSNPFDVESDLQVVAGVADDATSTVLKAMDLAGVGPDEPVVLVGHSLGGMAVSHLAELGTYRVVAVLTAGSPVGADVVPRGTQALHLEHAQDLVTGARGQVNPDQPNRTTVVRDLGDGSGIGAAHSLTTYIETADLLPADDPSISAFRAAADPVLGGTVTSVTTQTFVGTRVADESHESLGRLLGYQDAPDHHADRNNDGTEGSGEEVLDP